MLAHRTPRLSVVMPVHNAMPYLDAAVESILGQTFADFEFVILDDASTDGSTERLRHWARQDARIRLIEESANLGPALSSERVARAARAPAGARLDADDVSLPERLERQLGVLDDHPDVGVVGGLYDIIDADGRKIRSAEKWRLLQPGSIPPFGNGPMLYRRDIFEAVGGYRQQCEFWEDHDLILRMSAATRIMILPFSIYQVRQSRVSTRFASEQDRVERALDRMYRSRERIENGRPYDDLLDGTPGGHEKLRPMVFVSLGSVALWAGGRPRLFKRLLSRGALGFNLRSFNALVWTAWASLEPHSLRLFIRALLLGRQLRASRIVRTDRPIVWSGPNGLSTDRSAARRDLMSAVPASPGAAPEQVRPEPHRQRQQAW